MVRSMIQFAGIIVASFTLIGCVTNSGSSVATPPLPTGSWTLTTIESQPLPVPLPPGLRPITLTVNSDGAVSGNAGINRYSGTVDTGAWENREIVFGPLAVSRMAGPPAAMSIESAYLATLDAVRSFEVDPDPSGGTLTLSGVASELLVYERAE